MSHLIDTHILLWSLFTPKRLSDPIRDVIRDPVQEIYVSSVSFWEISIKFQLKKLELRGVSPHDLLDAAVQTGFNLLPLDAHEAATVHRLNGTWHRDPFDRLLIWQAISRSFTLITMDPDIHRYEEAGLRLLR